MRILFDNGTPSGIARCLVGHSVTEARELGWDKISNGDLLNAAEGAGFDVLLTTDKNIRYQQNLTPNFHCGAGQLSQWPVVRLHLDIIAATVNDVAPGGYLEVDIPYK